MVKEFSKEAIDNLKYYVYKLIDPRDGKVFYIGKGKGNRVFSHINLSLRYESRDEELSDKISLIREIKNDGLDVIAIIHRHGINDEDTAYQVEAALIDEYNNLTNIQGGHNSNDYGPINVNQVENIYGLEKLIIDDIDKSDKLLLTIKLVKCVFLIDHIPNDLISSGITYVEFNFPSGYFIKSLDP